MWSGFDANAAYLRHQAAKKKEKEAAAKKAAAEAKRKREAAAARKKKQEARAKKAAADKKAAQMAEAKRQAAAKAKREAAAKAKSEAAAKAKREAAAQSKRKAAAKAKSEADAKAAAKARREAAAKATKQAPVKQAPVKQAPKKLTPQERLAQARLDAAEAQKNVDLDAIEKALADNNIGQIKKDKDGNWKQQTVEEAKWDKPPAPGTKAHADLKKEDPARLKAMEDKRNKERAATKKKTPKASPSAPERPADVPKYVWDRATSNTLDGLNPTLVTNNPETRDALIDAGYGDWVKAAYEQHMDENANGRIKNGADPAEAWEAAQGVGGGWYADNHGGYKNDTVQPTGEEELTLGGSNGVTNEDYVAPKPPVVEPPPTSEPPTTGGGMFDNIGGTVDDVRGGGQTGGGQTGGSVTGPTQEEMMAEYERKLEEAQAAQQAAYEQQLKAQQEQYEKQKADAEAARQAEIERQAAARQAEIERRAAEKAAKEAANKKSWSNANAAAAGMTGGSAGPAYTKKYGQGSNAGGLMSGVNSVRGNPQTAAGARPQTARPPVDGAMPNGKPSNMASTPWADAFLRSKKAAEAPGPVSGMMSKWME